MSETQENQTPEPQTVDEKLDTLAEIVVANHQMLTALVNAVNTALQQEPAPQASQPSRQAPPIPYQPGYPPPVNEYQNVYGEDREYSSSDEQYRGPRTYNDLPQNPQQDASPPYLDGPIPPPPGGMPPVQPTQPTAQQQGTSGETVLTPEEYRAAHGE